MKTYKFSRGTIGKAGRRGAAVAAIFGLLLLLGSGPAFAQATQAFITGTIERITLDPPGDIWAGGTIKIGGETVIIPRNLLIDLPANRLTLQQLFEQAPPACQALGETGLAWTDVCLQGGRGGFATIHANRRSDTRVIAGDAFIEKGLESITGEVTHIDYTDGFLMVNGIPGFAASGTMVRINDPDARHTLQQGRGCDPALGPNCSADPRFTLDSDNYVITFITGYPACIPSTSARTGALGNSGGGAIDGSGDPLCPDTNRTANQVVANSTRFAPIQVGDHLTADGNYEEVNGVRFLSAHTLTVNSALVTRNDPTQPDYFIFAEVGIDTPGYENERVRSLFIGFSTRSPGFVNIWSLHYDPVTNAPHEFPLGSVAGCDSAAGAGACTNQGIGAIAGDIFKIVHDVDFVQFATGKPIKLDLSPCDHLRAGGFNVCPSGGSLAEQFSILSPVPHEIIGRTQHRLDALQAQAQGTPLPAAVDIQGNDAPWGEYLFPLGAGLGGIGFPEFVEVDLNKVNAPFPFEGLPWNLDRRLSPGGCDGPCEEERQPLCPFPYSELDPRVQAQTPVGTYFDPAYTRSPLTFARDRILSFVDGNLATPFFNGNSTVLPATPDAACIGLEPIDVPPQIIITTDTATFDPATGEWRVEGTLNGLFRNWASVIIHIGPTLNGQVLGTARVDMEGNWQFLETSTKVPDAGSTVSLEFPNGIGVLGVPLTIL
jgi:hypothetical protein